MAASCTPPPPVLALRPLLRLGNRNPFPLASTSSSEAGSSLPSATEAFRTGIDRRDGSSCVVCGWELSCSLDRAHLVPRDDEQAWQMLQRGRWIPNHVKSQRHESRNGLLLCRNHHGAFDAFQWFVRFVPERNEYVFVNFPDHPALAPYHDQPLRLNPASARAPFPSLFFYHENLCWARDPVGILPDPLIRQSLSAESSSAPVVSERSPPDRSHDDEDELIDPDGAHTIRKARRRSRCRPPDVFGSPAAASVSYSSSTRSGSSSRHDRVAQLYPRPLKRNIDPRVEFDPDRMRRLYGHRNWLNEDEVDGDGVPHRWAGTALENMQRWHPRDFAV